MGRVVRPTAEDAPPDPEGADNQIQDKIDGSRGGQATRYCVLKKFAKGPQYRGTENKQTCLDEHEGLDGNVIRFRMSSELYLSRCAELLAESVAIRLQPCSTGVQKCFDEHASLDTSQSQG